MGRRGLFVSFKQFPESVEPCVGLASGLVLCYRLHRLFLTKRGGDVKTMQGGDELEKLRKDGIVLDIFQYE